MGHLTEYNRICYNSDMQLTVKETAERLGVTQASIYIAIKDGRLRSDKKFGRIIISEKDADTYKATIGVKNGYVKRGNSEDLNERTEASA